jgi:hypothetical protein
LLGAVELPRATLGGLALAVGILVDDATVTIENIGKYLFAPLARIPGAPEALRHPHLVRLIPILDLRAIQAQRKLWTGATLKCEIANSARPTRPTTMTLLANLEGGHNSAGMVGGPETDPRISVVGEC